MATVAHSVTVAAWVLAQVLLWNQIPNGQPMFQGPVLKLTLKLEDLPLLGPDLFWIGLGIDPEAP